MKTIKKLMSFILAIITTQVLYAENKERVYVTNNYGEDVSLHLTWYPTSFMGVKSLSALNWSRTEEITLEEDAIHFELVAPLSAYRLYEIQATPAINNQSDYGYNDYGNAYAASNMNRIFNQYTLTNAKKSKFFIIDRSNKSSGVAGQNKITIKEYPSFEQYKKAVGMIERAQSLLHQASKIHGTNQITSNYSPKKEELKHVLTDEFMEHYYGVTTNKNTAQRSLSDESYIANEIENNQNLLNSWQNNSMPARNTGIVSPQYYQAQ